VYGILYISNSPAAKAYVPPAQKGYCACRYTVNPALFDEAARFSVFPGLVRALLQIATLLKKAQGTAGLGEFDATKTGDD